MTSLTLLAAVCGAVLTAGLVLAVWAFRAPPRPAGAPPSRLREAAAVLWRGRGRTPADRRRHRVTLVWAVTVAAFGWLLTGLPVLGLVLGAAVPGVPWLLAAGGAEKRAITRLEAVGEWTRRLRDVAGTGAGMQAAIVATAVTAPAPIADPVRLLAARLQAGWHGREALRRFADAIGDPVGDQIVAALLLHLRDRGDRLGAVLTSIAEATAKEVSMRKEADAERASARFSIRFMVGFTVATVAVASFSGDYLRPYTTLRGQVVLAVLTGTFVALLVWVRSMSRPAPVPRLFRGVEGGRP
ncbi:MAG TPA: type II secretion system F family protein [Natronosporangium sp.]|nr:type II secretion system F family protein [Natronosporangium sp.]